MNTRSCRSLFLFYCCLLLSIIPCILTAESAWNGHTPPGSSTRAPFNSYYVPPGAKEYHCTSPLIQYKGVWEYVYSSRFIRNVVRATRQKQATATLRISGDCTGFEWFGNCAQYYGSAKMSVDQKLLSVVDTGCNSTTPRPGQRLFATYSLNLTAGYHTVTIESLGDGIIDLNGLVLTCPSQTSSPSISLPTPHQQPRSDTPGWTLTQKGSTGVNAMQLAVISETEAIVIDKVEHNSLTTENGTPAWASLYNLKTHDVTPLNMQSNSFCAGGSFLSNGTLINVGGNPVVSDHTSAADFGDVDGLQSIRLFENGIMNEYHNAVRMASSRWYSTTVRVGDGSALIMGGSKKGGWINNATTNNPTIEFYPPKNIQGSNGLPVRSSFLVDTLNSNLFPIAFVLPDGTIFVAANNDAMIYDWKTNTERRLPSIPNGVRVTYPMAGTGLLLPLSSDNGYTPEVLLCGGSTVDDKKPGYEISSQDPASDQCSRMVLNDEGIKAGWSVEHMPEARLMPDAVLLPTGQIVVVNGAGSGISGYSNVPDPVGMSNAANPVLTPSVYDPTAPAGSRFSSEGMPMSNIPRMYHSIATLTPNGDIMIAGSNPNLDRSEIAYGTEYRVEWLSPPYMQSGRPRMEVHKTSIGFGEAFCVELPELENIQLDEIRVALMDLGFVTHAVHSNSRLVYLDVVREGTSGSTLCFKGPPHGGVYPPGPGFLYIVYKGTPSEGVKIMVGDGNGPPVDHGALENMLKSTQVDQYEKSKTGTTKDDEGSE
ncbi:copper radical oxidase [Gymnopus androsaceus JB14]|uniref:Copper radical oxidase n=1 Tax=Gymnopus androsaceus JB14 TaxID=1447944 RepID=A0A6A4H9T0_9AGAR|nr:copper radical oxidase [Gymnopus androsaceus JB14]